MQTTIYKSTLKKKKKRANTLNWPPLVPSVPVSAASSHRCPGPSLRTVPLSLGPRFPLPDLCLLPPWQAG